MWAYGALALFLELREIKSMLLRSLPAAAWIRASQASCGTKQICCRIWKSLEFRNLSASEGSAHRCCSENLRLQKLCKIFSAQVWLIHGIDLRPRHCPYAPHDETQTKIMRRVEMCCCPRGILPGMAAPHSCGGCDWKDLWVAKSPWLKSTARITICKTILETGRAELAWAMQAM